MLMLICTELACNCGKIVKIQLRLTLTVLYGDQTNINYVEIRAETF